ncbi:hypothetical protein ACL1HS_04550 [Corynebacterium striatum]|uniref:hypothetical protein n=1 Tax=Corynebacterium striatum TaxID=43770 RepID=UPI00141A5397|nr:hypothetical protein [Corynebacterium striatum]NHY10276.1 hypothetical protein [Corynebacterium striatum]NHY34518.1 hypothetical protein [Corynebacterium striatum]HAT1131453.1 hypothetical protein [Corynebacterium striatum]HAT1138782.1 hypothetical protein [Corynebacterium striatum]HAT1141451.1 hypothetical protein [Corynebacterium striatum]
MEYTSWDRTDREHPVLLMEAGPSAYGVFSADSADIDGQRWELASDFSTGATARVEDRVYALTGNLGRDKRIEADLNGRPFAFINENSGDWIVENPAGLKVAQFSTKNSGVRKAILEFDAEAAADALSDAETVALSWFTRLILEAKTQGKAMPIIATLVLASVVAVLSLFVF